MDVEERSNVFKQDNQGKTQPPRGRKPDQVNPYPLLNPVRNRGRYYPFLGLIFSIVGIIIADSIAIIIISYFNYLPYTLLIVLEIAISIIIIIPWIYYFSSRPLQLQIQERRQSESILQARLRLVEFASTHNLNELLEYSLDEVEVLTGSTVSFFHFLEPDQKTIGLQAWSTNTMQNMCNAEGKGSHYDLEKAGVWADAIRLRKPIVHNDYANLENRKGLPEGHSPILRELVVPILRDNKVVAILGVGNRAKEYSSNDIEVVATFADFAWDVVEYIISENAVVKSEEKFHTLVDWTYDWELWIDLDGNIGYCSPSCERISGYTTEEFIADPKLIMQIVHPDDRQTMEDHQRVIHDTSANPVTLEYRIIARDGSQHWIEHICRPLFGSDHQHLGRRISNRDITERKLIEQKISEQAEKEQMLTQTIHTLQADIGRDLHDSLGNHISFLRMNLEYLSEAQSTDPIFMKSQIQNMTKAANEAYEMIRAMLAILQTENFDDPPSLFSRYADQIAQRSTFQCELTSTGESKQLSLIQIRQLFYIFREALGNIEKHAFAKHVYGEFIWGDHGLTFNIEDDGTGFEPHAVQTSSHFGLKFMRERAEQMNGSFYIRSIPGHGTTITVVVPYESNQTDEV
jgi:PAS domain S-box-containing protein